MKPIVFARTRWNYDSYIDYWKLVELSGFPTCYVDEIHIMDDAVFIVCPFNGEIQAKFGNIGTMHGRATMLLWNLERPSGSNGLGNYARDGSDKRKYFHRILLSDRALAKDCSRFYQDTIFQYVPVGIEEGFGEPGSFAAKYYDLAHLSCYSNSRSWLFDTPSQPKSVIEGCSVAPNGWGKERHAALQKTKFMLCTHQDGSSYIEPLRYALAIAYGLPIIAEPSVDPYPYNLRYVLTNGNRIRDFVRQYDETVYIRAVESRQTMLRQFSFRKAIEAAVEKILLEISQ